MSFTEGQYLAEERAALQGETSPAPFHWIGTRTIFARLPPTRWLVPALQLCQGRPAMLAAYGSTGKTLAAQSLALAVSARRRVWSAFDCPAALTVRHVDHEQGRHATLKRYQRLALGMDLTPEDIDGRLQVSVYPSVYLNLADAEDAYAKACEGVDLVIIDALKGATPGVDENDSKIRHCIDTLSRVSDRTGTTFLIIHHSGKPKESHADARTVPRGSSAIFDACGSVLVMLGEKGKPKLVRHEKVAAEAEGGALEDFYLVIEDVCRGADPRAGVRVVHKTLGETEPSDSGAEAMAERFEALKRHILDVVRRHGSIASKNGICERVPGTRTTKLSAIQELLDERRLVEVNGSFRVTER
ncbi:AAA family ATPase [Chondromyces crocatus]|uniref:Uncharacterized protein n=1 Tax=Chondromyces crocatus TaxID=52 RepID=A0A0K1EBL7_CHOCO|nr:AAA family ATPase [Chondromyces crocatus]AKT38281.1 uncharacterized protein CMC5_024240 [Chondromyces crocatus]